MDAYQTELAGQPLPRPMIGASRTKVGSIAALVVSYFSSPQFLTLAPATQQTYRLILEKFRAAHGDKPVALLTRQHINVLLSQRVDTPAAANHWLRLVKALMAYAVEEGWRKDDPTRGIKRVKNRSNGFHTWTELGRIIAATPSGNLTLLITSFGKTFTAAGFGNWFREQCNAAGLPRHCAAHGLRQPLAAGWQRLAAAPISSRPLAVTPP
jgi:hypothetical protein